MQEVSGFEKGLLSYVKGDATYPVGGGLKIICHIVNNQGKWGAGFVLAVSKRWKEPELAYRLWHERGSYDFTKFQLGNVQFVTVEEDIIVANLIGQEGVGYKDGPPIRYEAVAKGLKKIADTYLIIKPFSVAMPRIGCGLSGGKWQEIEPLIKRELINKGINVTVYDLP